MLRIIAVLLLAIATTVAGAQTKVRVIAPPGEVNLPFWIAEAMDYFADADLDVSITHSHDSAKRLDELLEKRQDIAVVSLDDIVLFNLRIAKSQRPYAKTFALLSLNGGLLSPVTTSVVETLADLKGRRIAVESATSAQASLWTQRLSLVNLPPGTYEFVTVTTERERVAALKNGQADAALLMPVTAARAAAEGMRIFDIPAQAEISIRQVAAVNGNWLGRDEAVSSFAVACVRAMQWLHEAGNRQAAAAVLRRHESDLTEAQAQAAIELATTGRRGFSRDCVFNQPLTTLELEIAERRAGVEHSMPRRSAPDDPVDWSTARNAKDNVFISGGGGATNDAENPYVLARPLLNAFVEPKGDFGKTERMLERALRSRKQLSDGTWTIQAMYEGLSGSLGSDVRAAKVEQGLVAWRTAYPDSIHVRLAEAMYRTREAWNARGNEYASQVPKAAWERFHARLGNARATLDEIGPRAQDNPVWHWAMLRVAFAQGRPQQERAGLFAEAVRREPSFFGHYTEFARGLTPRWGGSVEEYRAFADAVVETTRATQGQSMYARLYPLLSYVESDRDPFKDVGIPWTDMRAGYDDLLKRHPDARREMHLYASFACRANDGKTYRALQPKLNAREFPVAGAYSFEYCNETLLARS